MNNCGTGCSVGSTKVNHFDDLVIFSPSSACLQSSLNVCSQFGIENYVKCNAKKNHVMIVNCKEHCKLIFQGFYLCGAKLNCKEAKYVGHYSTEDLCDDRDIYRQFRKHYAQGNTSCRKFHMCYRKVKVELVRAYCTPLYTTHLLSRYKAGIKRAVGL